MVKKNERDNRRAIAEQLRKEQQRKERRRSLLILGACVIVVLGLLGSASYVYWQDQQERKKAEGTPLAELGVSTSAADCDPVKKVDATGSGEHINAPQKIPYPDSPPAFGPHWPNFLQGSEIRSFYTTGDRPEVERLVHSLEHGHTILWYDEHREAGHRRRTRTCRRSRRQVRGRRLLHRSSLEGDRRRRVPAGQAHRADPLDRSGEPAGHHPVLRRAQRRGGQEVHRRLPKASNAPEPGAP